MPEQCLFDALSVGTHSFEMEPRLVSTLAFSRHVEETLQYTSPKYSTYIHDLWYIKFGCPVYNRVVLTETIRSTAVKTEPPSLRTAIFVSQLWGGMMSAASVSVPDDFNLGACFRGLSPYWWIM